MKKIFVVILAFSLILALSGSSLAQFGWDLGTRYHVALKDIPGTDFDQSHLSLLAGLRHKMGGIVLDFDVDYRPAMAEIDYSLAPKISLLIDVPLIPIYAGVGLKKTYVKWASGNPEWSELTYVLQAGWDLIALGPLSLILDAYYESTSFSVKDIDIDSITFGARLFWYT